MSTPTYRLLPGLLLALVLLTAACERMAQVDTQAEAQAIRSIDSTAIQALAAKDLTGITSIYAEDAVFMPPNTPQAATAADISAEWGRYLQANLSGSWEATKVEVAQSGDLAYSVGTYRVSMDAPNGTRVDDEGKYVAVWKKVAGQWKMVADSYNSNLPLPMAPPDTTAVPNP
jgi:ketosteroid isomerase-like protein